MAGGDGRKTVYNVHNVHIKQSFVQPRAQQGRARGRIGGTMAEKKSRSFVEQRRQTIVGMLQETGRMSVSDLSERLGISPLTVRRDLSYLEEQGVLSRRYGEAVLIDADAHDDAASASPLEAKKDAIARAAAALVHDHDLLLVNTSSTALMSIPYITAQGVTVVSNSLNIQSQPVPPSGMILVTGGEVRPPRGVLSGEFALSNIRNVAAAACFVGCAGVSLTAGITSTTQQEAVVNSLMVERSEQMVLLADSSKLGVAAGFSYASLDQVSLLITDTDITDDDIEMLREAGVRRIQCVG